ncbi:hypothetical protein [Bifidobacterium myosotis]|uniref:DNA-binding protein n=1 Tax=Bifidobacterium myosotis TaxID=1630166 RepID=A0A5M9ZH35_9BIFI|nr:hypothetical protein [Bifidobacterium myosotis]KAA8826931.1 hypothetical protein EMO91_10395 [Bifidobacterium myosotis]
MEGADGLYDACGAAALLGVRPCVIPRIVAMGRLRPASADPLRFDGGEIERYRAEAERQKRALIEFIRIGEEMGLDD